MAKYLSQGSYTLEGLRGMLKEGGTGREKATREMVEAAGGRLEAYYFVFGSDDFVLITEFPDNVTSAAVSLFAASSGAVNVRTSVLLTPAEIDEATKKTVSYRPPGK